MISLNGDANPVSCSVVFENIFSSVPQFCFPVVNPNYELLKPHEFDLVKLRIFSSTALGGPIHGFECLWMVLGLVTKGHRSFECCCVQLKPFAPFPNKYHLFSHPTHIQAHTLHHPVSEPPLVSQGDLWGEAGFVMCRLPSGGVTATFVFQRSPGWREKQAQWSQRIGASKTLCLPSE